MRTKHIVLSGSTKFKREFLAVATRLRASGAEVVLPSIFEHTDRVFLSKEQRARVDQEYLRAIEKADCVFVIDVSGYMGESTRAEVVHAQQHRKPCFYYSLDFKGAEYRK